jgi:hypothetical protein
MPFNAQRQSVLSLISPTTEFLYAGRFESQERTAARKSTLSFAKRVHKARPIHPLAPVINKFIE